MHWENKLPSKIQNKYADIFINMGDGKGLITIIRIRDGFESKIKTSDKMSDKEKMFYDLLVQMFEKADFVTTKMMSDVTGMAESTTRRYLTKFCDWEIIKSEGKNRGMKYYLL